MSIYDFQVKDAKGNQVGLSNYKGKVLLIVNSVRGITKIVRQLSVGRLGGTRFSLQPIWEPSAGNRGGHSELLPIKI